MKSAKLSILGMTGLLCTALAAPPMLYAQATAPSHEKAASEEMQASGTAAKGMEPGQTLKHAYRATRDEVTDAALTTEIKAALMRDRETRTTAIHVKSNQGLVTLTGTVDSPQVAARAQKVAAGVSGVQSVKNELTWHTSAAAQ